MKVPGSLPPLGTANHMGEKKKKGKGGQAALDHWADRKNSTTKGGGEKKERCCWGIWAKGGEPNARGGGGGDRGRGGRHGIQGFLFTTGGGWKGREGCRVRNGKQNSAFGKTAGGLYSARNSSGHDRQNM